MTQKTATALLSISIDRMHDAPLHKQVYTSLRDAILAGRLSPGEKLPSSRLLTKELGISRNTIVTAFEMLASEGYTEAITGSATRVSHVLPDSLQIPITKHMFKGKIRKSVRVSVMAVSFNHSTPIHTRKAVPFLHSTPDVSQFPVARWNKLLNRYWKRPSAELLLGGDLAGYQPLRKAIANHLGAYRAITCEENQIIITTGAQQALDLTCRVLLNSDDCVWLENPAYPGLLNAITAVGASAIPLKMDNEGLCVEEGISKAPQARAVAVTPSHHYPLGVTMSLARRLALLDWADQASAWIIEDDYDSEFRYGGRPLSALQGLDRTDRVIYVGTFSKTMFPSLRVGYLVVPPDLIDPFLRVRRALDDQPPITVLPALAAFMDDGHFAAHIRRMRSLYAERQEALYRSINQHLAAGFIATPSDAGMHLCCLLKPELGARMNDREIVGLANLHGITLSALSEFYHPGTEQQGVLLGYAGFTPEQIDQAASQLAKALKI